MWQSPQAKTFVHVARRFRFRMLPMPMPMPMPTPGGGRVVYSFDETPCLVWKLRASNFQQMGKFSCERIRQ